MFTAFEFLVVLISMAKALLLVGGSAALAVGAGWAFVRVAQRSR
jgi:hypothetical protein